MLEMLKNLDAKSIIIIILASLLVIFTIFQPNKKIETYKDEIKVLHQKNKELLHSNDSLKIVNQKIDKELEKIYGIIRITEKLIVQYDNRINDLKNKQNETSNRVNVLNADGVASEFANYIKKRSGKGIRK
jgi:predicted RNase H-like nuclease (RuvC/YqgF family)